MQEAVTSDRQGRGARSWLWVAAVLLLVVAVHLPSLGLGLVGDDFEWWLETVRRMDEPLRLVHPFGGLRLTNPVLLMPDLVLWKDWIPGWHITNLFLHGAVMVLLFGIGRRLGLPAPIAALLVALWGISPYTAFQVREIHPRHDPLLLACWLGIGLSWPGPGERWTRGRAVAAGMLALVSALTKETWVVLPGVVAAYEVAIRRSTLLRALRSAVLWSVGPLAYVIGYALWPPVGVAYAASYYGGGLAAAAKIPSTFAAFCGLGRLDVTSLRFGPLEWLSVVVLVVLAAVTARTREPLLVVGLAFFLLPFIPVIPVGFMIARYAYVPFAGFLFLAAGVARLAATRARTRVGRLTIAGVAAAAVLAVGLSGLSLMARETSDAQRRDEGHRRLVDEAQRFWGQLPRDRPLVCVRLEGDSINSNILRDVEGLPKAYFERATYPYGLVRWAELMSWTGWQRGGPMWREIAAGEVGVGSFAVIGHVEGRFVTLPVEQATVAAEAEEWSERGYPVRVIEPVPGS